MPLEHLMCFQRDRSVNVDFAFQFRQICPGIATVVVQ